ncbi:MAG: T9SS type A sorting domain-containing protein [Bacteroidetes bacterium]|nr:T9SS type A sorting domain-containing protein [Bacteroidota bacterium]
MKKKFIAGIGIIGLGIVLLSFANGEEPKMKRYEVIRSVNGNVTSFDTLVPSNSTFTPENYLAQLGFSEDKHVEIIFLPAMHGHMAMPFPHPMPTTDSVFIMNFTGGSEMMDSMVMFEINMDEEHAKLMEEMGHGQVIIEKNMVIRQGDSINGELEEIEEFMRTIEIEMGDMPHPGCPDSAMILMHTVVMGGPDADSMHQKMMQMHTSGDPAFERHIEDGHTKMDFMVFGDEKDFTLLIVSDGGAVSPKSQMQIETVEATDNVFKLYPNPADKEVAVQLNFEEKATTTLTVSDSNGKVVMQLNLGEFSGNYTQAIDVSKWSKGIYFVNIDRPGMKLVEKLVVE